MARSGDTRHRRAAEMQERRDVANQRAAIEHPLRVRIAELEKELATLRKLTERRVQQREILRRMCRDFVDIVAPPDSGKDPV